MSTVDVAGSVAGDVVAEDVTGTDSGVVVDITEVASLQPARVRTEHPSTSHVLRVLFGINGKTFKGAAPLLSWTIDL
ncbi:hypothetical protein [Paenibacillus qinlingensis]|uniref:hypothetical protein n=1 Tax=Paenibacillus qinlingensis TaxID=1837343 RepID=UPI00286E9BE5|nr:hypothetical protein [Paenibacillus qinlingensis]